MVDTKTVKYVPDQCKTKEICAKVIIENYGMLGFIPYSNKDQKMGDKAVNAIRLFPNFYKTQKICNKVVGTYSSEIQFVLERQKSQKTCDKAVDTCTFL